MIQQFIRTLIEDYQGASWLSIIYIMCLIYIVNIQNDLNVRKYVVVILASVTLVFNDVSLTLWNKLFGKEIMYYFMSAIPVFVSMAFCICTIILREKEQKRRIKAIILIAVIILLFGNRELFSNVLNKGQIKEENAEIVAISEYFKGNYESYDGRPVVLCTRECYNSLKTFYPMMLAVDIKNASNTKDGNEDGIEYTAAKLVDTEADDDYKKVKKMLSDLSVEYIVISNKHDKADYLAKLGFFAVTEQDIYNLYQKQEYDINCGIDGYIRRLYYYLLNRKCTEDELVVFNSAYSSGTMSSVDIAMYILNSDEYQKVEYSYEEFIYILFQAIQNRKPDSGDIEFMINYLNGIDDKRFIVEQYMNSDYFWNSLDEQYY